MHLKHIMTMGILLSSGLAAAGYVDDRNVGIDLSKRHAFGSMGVVRNSPDSQQYLICVIQATASGISGYCAAMDIQGNYAYCSTTNQYMLEMIKSLGDTSHLSFSWGAGQLCTEIEIRHGTWYGPKR